MKKHQGTLSVNRRGGESAVKRSALARVMSIALALVIALSAVSVSVFNASARTDKDPKTYDIAVVYDNSGSMYVSGRTRWSLAKYAMEIFASMIDYGNGSKLSVYPMHPVVTDGTTPESGGEMLVTVTKKEDISKIHNMYTPDAGGTPYDQVNNAAAALGTSGATEKWLILLTDGVIDGFTDSKTLTGELQKVADRGINVQYLGISVSDGVVPDDGNNLYSDTSNDSNIESKLIDICNKIFERNELETGLNRKTKELTLDVSMSSIIVFVQGNGANVTSLKDAGGKESSVIMDSGLITYSDKKLSAGNYDCVTDTSLYGRVITFDACPKGKYKIEYTGDNIQIFYEPDVDINILMKNSDGQTVDPEKDTLYPGNYSFEYSVVDNITEADVTDSPLVDVENLDCEIEITNGEEKENVPYESGDAVTLEEGDSVFLNIHGRYLEDYTISTTDNRAGFTFKIVPFPEVPELDVEVDVEQSNNWYNLKERDEWKPIKVYAELDDQKLTDEQMASVTPTFTFSPEIPYKYEIIPGESAYAVYIGKDAEGKDVEPVPAEGNYKITASLVYTDEHGQQGKPEDDDDKFEIRPYSKIWEFLIWIIAILGLIGLIIAWLQHKVYPEKLELADDEGNIYKVRRSGNTVFLSSTQWPNDITATVKKVTKWKDRKRPTLCVTGINFGGDVESANIDGNAFTKSRHGNEWLLDGDEVELGKLKHPIRLKNGASIKWINKETAPNCELTVR